MKRLVSVSVLSLLIMACGTASDADGKNKASAGSNAAQASSPHSGTASRLFAIESAYIKFRNEAAGQEMTREWWFDSYGARQYEENYGIFMGQKSGDQSIILDGFKYMWRDDSSEGQKNRYYQQVTDYDKVTQREIDRYGIVKHGYEEVCGKKCLKVSMEKPAKSTVWVWNNITLKLESVFGGNKVTSEAVEIVEGSVDPQKFELPKSIVFQGQ